MHLNKKVIAGVVAAGIGLTASAAFADDIRAVSYTHLTLPTNREV